MTSWNFGKSPGNSKLILILYYLLDSAYKIFPVRPPYIKEFVKKMIMAVCLKFDQLACRKYVLHMSDAMINPKVLHITTFPINNDCVFCG